MTEMGRGEGGREGKAAIALQLALTCIVQYPALIVM